MLKEVIKNTCKNYIFGHLKHFMAKRAYKAMMIYVHEAILMQARRWTLGIAGNKCTVEVAQRS